MCFFDIDLLFLIVLFDILFFLDDNWCDDLMNFILFLFVKR